MAKMTWICIRQLSKWICSYRVTIKAVDHKGEAGNYRADAYIVDRTNKRHYISEKVVSVNYSRPSASLTIENNNAVTGTFDAVVKNIIAPTGVKEILVPSWSLVGGQDDLIWHKATKQADGSYRATIKASDHKNSTGKYRADAYIVDNFNKRFYSDWWWKLASSSSKCKQLVEITMLQQVLLMRLFVILLLLMALKNFGTIMESG